MGQKLTIPVMRVNLNTLIENKEDLGSSQQLQALTIQSPEKDKTIESTVFAANAQYNVQNKPVKQEEKKCAYCSKSHYSSQCRTFNTAAKRRDALPQ